MSSDEILVVVRVADRRDHLAAAVRSILEQDVRLHLVIVDDASQPPLLLQESMRADSRITLVRHEKRLGRPASLRAALSRSTAPFVAEVPANAELLPGALHKLRDECEGHADSGLAHCFHFALDVNGQLPRQLHRNRRKALHARYGAGSDAGLQLLSHPNAIGPLRLFRRRAIEASFPRPGGQAADFAMLLAVADRFEVVTVTEFLYRTRDSGVPERATQRIRRAFAEARVGRKVLAADGRFARRGVDVRRLLRRRVQRSLASLFPRNPFPSLRRSWRRVVRGARGLVERLHLAVSERFRTEAMRVLPRARGQVSTPRRVAYYLWHFPVLSQTFVNRELVALRAAEVDVEVIADAGEDPSLADSNAREMLERTTYLDSLDPDALERERRRLRRSRPVAYFRVLSFAIVCRYTQRKNIGSDRAEMKRAIALASVLRRKGIGHVHAPWADRCSLVALMASRLAGIPFSVQVRAHEIHRRNDVWGLRERLLPASFIVTNTLYNEQHLRALLGDEANVPIHVVHNGLDLDRFTPRDPIVATGGRPPAVRLLSVGRLIEQKGFVPLLEACRILMDCGVDFECEIVGAPEEPLYTRYFVELKRLRRRLRLEGAVRFSGALPLHDVIARYRSADLFVLPCIIAADGARDIIPNALLEAMAMALPVVSTPVGGVPEMVEDGVSGVLVPPGDAAALAAAIAALAADPQRSARLGAAARQRIEQKFDIRRNIRQYVELFSSAAGVDSQERASNRATVRRSGALGVGE